MFPTMVTTKNWEEKKGSPTIKKEMIDKQTTTELPLYFSILETYNRIIRMDEKSFVSLPPLHTLSRKHSRKKGNESDLDHYLNAILL